MFGNFFYVDFDWYVNCSGLMNNNNIKVQIVPIQDYVINLSPKFVPQKLTDFICPILSCDYFDFIVIINQLMRQKNGKKTFIHHRSIFANGDINITNKNVIDYVII